MKRSCESLWGRLDPQKRGYIYCSNRAARKVCVSFLSGVPQLAKMCWCLHLHKAHMHDITTG